MAEQPNRVIPTTEPVVQPLRRMDPGKVCPAQRARVAERVKREVPAP